MNTKLKEFIKFFILFYSIGVLLFATFNLSFYIYDFLFLLSNWRKLLFILIYSAFLSIYFSIYIVFQQKHGRPGAFVSGLLAIHYLQEYQHSIGWSNFFYLFEEHRFLIEVVVAASSLGCIIVSDLIQIYHIRQQLSSVEGRDYFVWFLSLYT